MKKITLTADEALLKRAQAKARADKTTLSAEFRRWLEDYAAVDTVKQAAVRQPARNESLNKFLDKLLDKSPDEPRHAASKQRSSGGATKPQPEKPGMTLARCVDALKKFEKRLEEKL